MDCIPRHLFRLCQVSRCFGLTLFDGFDRALRNDAYPNREAGRSRMASFRLACRCLQGWELCFQGCLVAVHQQASSRPFVFGSVYRSVEHVNLTCIVRCSVFGALYQRFHDGDFNRLLNVTMRASVNGSRALVNVVAARFVVSACCLQGVVNPRQAVDETGCESERSTRFLRDLLCKAAVFSCCVEVMACRFVPVIVYVSANVRRAAVRHTGTTGSVSKRGGTVYFVGDRRYLQPVRR